MSEEETFIIYWRDGTTSILKGQNIIDACNKAGIGIGAVPAIDYWKKLNLRTD